MRISRVHIGARLVVGEEITLDKSQGHYLKHVLRLKSGAALLLFNGQEAVDYHATLILDGKKTMARIEAMSALETESKLETEVIQGLGRADHMDWMIQKTTELGVHRISIFNAKRTQSPLKPALLEKKLAHWSGVAISACEQSGRAILPDINFYSTLNSAIEASSLETRLLLDFDGEALIFAVNPAPTSVSILLGPEGGLGQAEIQLARSAGFSPIRLGPRVLRTETAATAALSIVQSTLGDLT
ncbi:MAG: 16S rRNA (uracil(1498)-N(3))-methyltransferase [Gammaproteobacteria bacterium]|nr:16S rRNA (uracil(1498)-N(3))-methyltransferase [Gammaproteobacteria bacterium]